MKKIIFTISVLISTITISAAQVSKMLSTTWDQGCNYNANCPAASGGECGKAYTGCGATSMGQILKYYAFPSSGWSSNTYTPTGFSTQSADFSAATYDYSAMPNKLTSSNAEAAKLLYHCGVALNMQYGGTGSYCFFTDISDALKKNFKYSPAIRYAGRLSYSLPVFDSLIKDNLDKGMPVLIKGNSSTGDHFWIIDGYNNTSPIQYHMNFGWSGIYDGYYTLSNINPGPYNFSPSGILLGIKPADNFEFSPSKLDASSSGGASGFPLEISSQYTWTISTKTPWISLPVSGGTSGFTRVTVSCLKNESRTGRSGYVYLEANGKKDSVLVNQSGDNFVFEPSKDTLYFDAIGSSQKVMVTVDYTWTANTTDSWISVTPKSNNNTTEITITAASNVGSGRNGKVTLSNFSNTKYITVIQSAPVITSIIEAENEILVYPNPSKDYLNVSLKIQKEYHAELYDAEGKILSSYNFDKQVILNLNDYKNGFYYLKITDNAGNKIGERKIVKL